MKGYVGSTSRDSRAAAVREEPQSRGRSIEGGGGGGVEKPLKAQTDGVHAKPRMPHTHTPYRIFSSRIERTLGLQRRGEGEKGWGRRW